MQEQSRLDQTYHFIISRMKETGVAPHYTEIAKELGISMEDGRKTLHELVGLGIPGIWMAPDTDYIASFAPFSNQPTQYRISVEGQQKWFGQWGFESLAVSWLYPGKSVMIEAPCLDCGKPVQLEMRDGRVREKSPSEIKGYVAVPFSKWMDRIAYSWSNMNLFRSEEHIRSLPQFDPSTEEGILELDDLVQMFSGNFFRRRLDPDYVSNSGTYTEELFSAVAEMAKTRPFWRLK